MEDSPTLNDVFGDIGDLDSDGGWNGASLVELGSDFDEVSFVGDGSVQGPQADNRSDGDGMSSYALNIPSQARSVTDNAMSQLGEAGQ